MIAERLEQRLERIEEELRRLAAELAALRQTIPDRGTSTTPLIQAAPAQLQPLVEQVMTALTELLGETGAVRVLIAGLHRRPDGLTTSWYELFADEAVAPALNNPSLLRALGLVATPERLRLLYAFATGSTGSAEVMEKSGLSQGQFYHHLRALEAAGMVRKAGRDRYKPTTYGISTLFTLLAAAHYIGQELTEEEAP